jgi:hypothetical protein
VFSAFRATNDMTIGANGDYGAQLAVVNNQPAWPAVIVRGAAGQTGVLQAWQNSAGTTVASIDNSGNLTVAGGGFLSLNANGRLNLHGTVGGSPWGTIHIGPEGGPVGDIRGSIAFEPKQSAGQVPPNIVRIYFASGGVTPSFVIQYYYNGQNYYAYLPLTGGQGGISWAVTTTPF